MTRANLKIGFVFDDSLDSNDGVSQQVKTYGKWLSEQGHQVRYLVGETKIKQWCGGRVYSLTKNVTVLFNGNKLSIPRLAKKAVIKEILERENFDVLHVQMPHSPLMAQKVVNTAGSEVAIIGTFHILPSNRLSSWGSKGLRKMYRTGLGRFDQVISVSKPAAEFAQKNFGLKSVILPNVVELERFRTDTVIKQSNAIVFLGRLVRRKGCSELIKAYALLKKSLPSVNLVIGGDGPERKPLKRLVGKLGLNDSIKFAGYIDENEKSKLLASAQIACFPATGGESFGIVLLEAMAAGSGVVLGGNNPGYASVLGEQPLLLVNPYDTQEFAARLQLLFTQKATIQGLHSWQTENVRQYDVSIVGNKLENIYRAAIANRGKNRHN